MITLDTYDVKIFTDRVEPGALDQLRGLMAIPAFAGCRVRVMPDVHAGAGCVIGFTGDLGEKVVPNIVGVDIGCGILVQPFGALRHVDDTLAPSSTSKRRSEPCGRRDGGKSHGCGTVSTQRGGASACGAGRLFLAVNQLEPTGGGGGCPNRRFFEREKRSTPCGT